MFSLFRNLQSGKYLKPLRTPRNALPHNSSKCLSVSRLRGLAQRRIGLVLLRQAHPINPHSSGNLVVELAARWSPDPYEKKAGVRCGFEFQSLLSPRGRADHILCSEGFFPGIVGIKNLESWPAIRSDSCGAHITGKPVSGIRTNQHVVKQVAIVEVLRSVEVDAHGSFALKRFLKIHADSRPFQGDNAPVQTSVQDVRLESAVRHQVRRRVERSYFFWESFSKGGPRVGQLLCLPLVDQRIEIKKRHA